MAAMLRRDDREPRGEWWYHGTRAKNLDRIRRDGLESNYRSANDWEPMGEYDEPPQAEMLYMVDHYQREWGTLQLRVDSDCLPRGAYVYEDRLRGGGEFRIEGREPFAIPPECIQYQRAGHWYDVVASGDLRRRPYFGPVIRIGRGR